MTNTTLTPQAETALLAAADAALAWFTREYDGTLGATPAERVSAGERACAAKLAAHGVPAEVADLVVERAILGLRAAARQLAGGHLIARDLLAA